MWAELEKIKKKQVCDATYCESMSESGYLKFYSHNFYGIIRKEMVLITIYYAVHTITVLYTSLYWGKTCMSIIA